MELSYRVTRALHEDHMAVIALLQTVSSMLSSAGRDTAPNPAPAPDATPTPTPTPTMETKPADSRFAGLLLQLAGAVEGEVGAHFTLEEDGLFPLLAAAGEGGLGQLLTEEHAIILPLGHRVAALARGGAQNGFDAAGWSEFRRLGLEFAGLLIAHAEKEEMGLLPVLEEILAPDDDQRLADAYEAGLYAAPAAANEKNSLAATPNDNDPALAGEAAR